MFKISLFKLLFEFVETLVSHTHSIFLPSTHVVPFPEYLALHAQEYDPGVFVHTALTSQE